MNKDEEYRREDGFLNDDSRSDDYCDDDRSGDFLVALNVSAIIDGSGAGCSTLVLKEIVGRRRILMSITDAAAQSIAVQLAGLTPKHPLTHDLMAKMMAECGIRVSRIIIEDMDDGFFITNIVCEQGGLPHVFEARTSDAVALALRCHTPIFAREGVLAELCPRGAHPAYTHLTGFSAAELQKMLANAVAKEDYEEAQKIKEALEELKAHGKPRIN